ncbi:MAG: MFS transporter, partial [Maritimibacter sp.]
LAFAPILLSISPTPAFDTTRRMTLRDLYKISPLGLVGMLLMGGVFAAQWGMASVFATEAGLGGGKLSLFIAMIYVGGMLLQYPIGWISDRMDRRLLIIAVALIGAVGAMIPIIVPGNYDAILVAAFLIGGTSNPLYALIIAYTNDFLEVEDMPAASSGLMFVNGLGAITGPLLTGWVMGAVGPNGYFLYLAAVLLAMVVYGVWRTTQRASVAVEDTASYAPVLPSASPVAMDMAQEFYADAVEEAAEDSAA